MRTATALRILLVLLGALASVATSRVEPGERVNGDCPEGEACSDATPEGLYFAGTPSGDEALFASEWPKATALGGTQRVRLYLDEEAKQPLDLPFAASLDGEALSLQETDAASAVLRGESAGSARLRVTDPETDLLYDRIELEARAVSRYELVPAGRYLWYDTELLGADYEVAVWAEGEARVTAAMFSEDDARVIDDAMTVSGAAGVSEDPLGYVDTVLVAPEGPGVIELAIEAGEGAGTAELRAVASADEIASLQGAGPIEVGMDGTRTACFRAESEGALVLGGSWSFQIGSHAVLSKLEDEDAAHCVELHGTEVGADTLTVSAAGASVDFPVDVVNQTTYSSRAVLEEIEPTLPGQRAESAEVERVATPREIR